MEGIYQYMATKHGGPNLAPRMAAIARNPEHQAALKVLWGAGDKDQVDAYFLQIDLETQGSLQPLLNPGQVIPYENTSQFRIERDHALESLAYGVLEGATSLPPEVQEAYIASFAQHLLESTGAQDQFVKYVPKVANIKAVPKGAATVLVFGLLSFEAVQSIRQWYNGEISGTRCKMNILNATGSSAGTVLGGAGGVVLGAALGDLGIVAGSVVGSCVGGVAGNSFASWLTSTFFDVPRDVSLENAYKFLGVTHRASNDEVNKAYRLLLLKHYPGMDGPQEDFHRLQVSLEYIRAHRDYMAKHASAEASSKASA